MSKERKEKVYKVVKVIIKTIQLFVNCTAVAFVVLGALAFIGSKLTGASANWWATLRTSLIVGGLTLLVAYTVDKEK